MNSRKIALVQNHWLHVAVAGLLALIGVATIYGANAAVFSANAESENGVLTNGAVITDANGASNGKTVAFRSSSTGGTVTPVPAGTWSWKGQLWTARTDAGAPAANGVWDPNNVGIDEQGNLHLKITSVSGTLRSAEVDSVVTGRGYGTYTFVLGSPVNTYDKNIVAGLFTYDDSAPAAGHREIDFEASAWGGDGPVAWTHTYWPELDKFITPSTITATADSSTRHVLVWAPGKLTWRTYRDDGSLMKESVATQNVPAPGNESVIFNLWVFEGDGWQQSRPAELILKDFTFVPQSAQ